MDISKKEVTVFQRLGWLVNILMHQIMAITILVGIWQYLANPELNSLMTLWWWHIILTTIAYMLLMFQGIIMFHKNSVLTLFMTRKELLSLHTWVMSIAYALMFIGTFVIMIYKPIHNEANLTTDHGKVGFASAIICTASLLLGIMVNYNQALKSFIKPIYVKYLHVLLGLAGYVIGVASIIIIFVGPGWGIHIQVNNYFIYLNLVLSSVCVFYTLYTQMRNMF